MPSSVTATCFARASRDWNGTRPEAEADCGVATSVLEGQREGLRCWRHEEGPCAGLVGVKHREKEGGAYVCICVHVWHNRGTAMGQLDSWTV